MTGTDWLDQLEQKAAAATPGPWTAANGYVETIPEFDLHRFDVLALLVAHAKERDEDAEFIAAANPHTVQRLINELRDTRQQKKTLGLELVTEMRHHDDTTAKVAAIRTILDDAPHTDVFTLDAAIRNALNGSTR